MGATDWLPVPGRKTLAAAGDRLRDLIVPDALAQAVSGTGKRKKRDVDNTHIEEARKELDELVATTCPLCEGVIASIDKPFIKDEEDVGDWAI